MYNKKFYDESIKKTIKLAIINNNKIETKIITFLKKYMLKINKKYRYIGFDLEFNTPPKSTGLREIAIFQLCFHMKNSNLILFYNPKIASIELNNLIKEILINKYILKIGHGTDSLDIQALYKYLDNKKYCKLFTNNLYDTRFICEYLNIFTDNKLCNIYFLLKQYNVVSKEQYIFLEENHKQLGDFWNSYIDICNLSTELINYSLYDALYLVNLYKKMILNIDKKIIKLLMEVMHIVFLIKKNIFKFPDINKFNIFINTLDINIKNIFQIALFKNVFIKICMLLYYKNIINNILIYSKKDMLILENEKQYIVNSYNIFFKKIKKYKKLNKIIDIFYKSI